MRRISLVCAGMVLLLGGLGAGAYFGWRHYRGPREPLLGGKTEAAWLEELRSPDPVVGMQAAEQLVNLGEAGLPVLLAARKDADLRAHRRGAAGLVRLGALAAPALVEVVERGGARVETSLVRIGPPALPALEKALGSAERARPAARVLGAMGPRARPAVAALVGLLQNLAASEEARAEAATALGFIGPDPADGGDAVVGALSAALSGPSKVRLASARALRQIGPAGRAAAPSLVRLVRDPDAPTAAAACEALGQMGGAGAVAPLVARLLAADGASKAAGLALARLGPAARPAVASLIGVLKSEKEDRWRARDVLERLGTTVVPDLQDALKDDNAATRRGVAEVLGLMGPRAVAAVEALVRMLKDEDAGVATSAALALLRIEPAKAGSALPVLVRLLKDKDEKAATGAARVLAEMGPDARPAVGDLLEALKSKDEKTVRRAASVLGRIRPTTVDVVAGLRSALSGSEGGRPAAAQALGLLGGEAKAAIPDLLEGLKQPALRPYAALAVAEIDPARLPEVGRALAEDLVGEGPAQVAALTVLRLMPRIPAEVTPALRPLLADRQTARAALAAVRQLQPRMMEELIPDLATLLSDSDAELRQEAGLALRRIGAPALAALKRALSSPSPATRAAAAWTLDDSFKLATSGDTDFLLPLLTDKDESVRQNAAATLAVLGVRSKEAVDTMVALLSSSEVDLRRSAVWALRPVVGDSSTGLGPHLLECLFDPDEEMRQAAARLLRDAWPPMTVKATILKEALNDQSPAVRLAVADTLARSKAATVSELAPGLLALAKTAEPAGRRAVLEVLFDLSPERARELRPQVEADLRGESVVDRTEAGEWLMRLMPGAAGKVLPFLVGVLNGWDVTARLQAVVVLGRLGPSAKVALPALKRRAALDEDARVRREARAAVEKIEKTAR